MPTLDRNCRISSIPRLLAPSISSTSTSSPLAICWQMSHSPQGVVVGPSMQFSALGENSGGRGLAHAAGAGEQIGMSDAVGRDCILQAPGRPWPGRPVLRKRLRTVSPGDDDIFTASGADHRLPCDQPCQRNNRGAPVRTCKGRCRRTASDPRTRVHRLGLLRLRPDPVHGSPSQGPLATPSSLDSPK